MKRLLFILFIVLCFSSCKFMQNESYIAVQVIQNGVLLEKCLDFDEQIYYYKINKDDVFTCRYFLLPYSDEKIDITTVTFDYNLLTLVSDDYPELIFKPIKNGRTIIDFKTKTHGSTSTLELRIVDN